MQHAPQRSNQCAVLISEENDEPIIIAEEHRGRYCVTFDPLVRWPDGIWHLAG